MPLNGATLETEILAEITSSVISEADWSAQVKKDIKDQLQIQIGEPAWTSGDMDNSLNIVSTALGAALVPHLEAIVASVAAKTLAHIVANAVVSTETEGNSTQACTAGGASGTTTGTGTGTVA